MVNEIAVFDEDLFYRRVVSKINHQQESWWDDSVKRVSEKLFDN